MNTVERILELIKHKGITKNSFLNDLNLNKNSFVNWTERGTSPSGEILLKIANYFNVTTDYLIGNNAAGAVDPATDEQLKFALYGDIEIDDDILKAVKEFADFQLKQLEKRKEE